MMDHLEDILKEIPHLTESYMQDIIGKQYLKMHMNIQGSGKLVKPQPEEK